MRRPRLWAYAVSLLVGGSLLAVYLFPVYWTLITSLKPLSEMMQTPPTLFPQRPTFENYREMIVGDIFVRFLRNSLVIAVGATLLTLALAVGSGFSLSRIRFRGQALVNHLLLLVYLFPGIILAVPIFILMVRIGLYNTVASVIIVHVFFTLPFAAWTLRHAFDAVPSDLEDAARIDGATRLAMLARVFLPLALPAVSTVAIYAFVVSWNEYLFATVLLSKPQFQTLPVGIASWTSSYTVNWGQVSAAAILSLVPVVALFAWLGRFFVSGLMAGAHR